MKTKSYAPYGAQPEWRGASSAAGGELERIRKSLELVGRLSDRLIPIGPWGVGIDALFNFIPGVGEAYSAIAGGFILIQAATGPARGTAVITVRPASRAAASSRMCNGTLARAPWIRMKPPAMAL